jgi:LuxR family maltose regulon positive regulatory protein
MNTPLLKTKLYVPPIRPELVSRPRLIERLNAGMTRKLTLISTPAGFGKTTLLSEWAGSCGQPVAWVSLDEGDNDPARFWTYLVAALQTIETRQGTVSSLGESTLDALQSPRFVQATSAAADTSSVVEAVVTTLINQISIISDFVLVLDDYHLVTVQPIHDALAFLLDHLPDNAHLVIATRADPPLPIARLRGRGQLTELRLTDLRFTFDEAAEFLRRVMGLELSADDVAALASRTEGWIAGLQMAAVSMQGQEDVANFIRAFTGSDRYILDYLVEEVLLRQPDTIQNFLLQTAILDRLTGSLCDAITEQDDGQATLEMLERANLFIVPLDNERQWYRYHRLFTDLLRRRLQQAQPDLVPMLHRRASEWYEHSGLMAQAIDHALSAQDFERAALLIEQIAEETMMRSEVATLLRWLDMLPDELVRARPSLCIHHAWALLFSGRSIDNVEARLQDAGDDADLALGQATVLRAFVAIFQGQIPRAAELSLEALELLPEDDLFSRSIVAWNLSLSYLVEGDIVTGLQTLEEVAKTSQKAGNVMITVTNLCYLAELYIKRGLLYKAQTIYQQALELATDRQGQPLPIAGMALIGLGELARERNDLEAAMRYLTEGIECIGQWGEIGALDGYISLAHVRLAQGDMDGAQDAIQNAWRIAVNFDATEMDDVLVAAHQAHLWVIQGSGDPGHGDPSRLEAAARWFEEQGLTTDVALSELEKRANGDFSFGRRRRTRTYTTLARLLIAQHQFDQALTILALLLTIAERWGLDGYVIGHLVLTALAFHAQGDSAQAMSALERALSIGESGGFVRAFVDEGPPMAQLLYEAAARGITPEYAGKLLAAFPDAGLTASSPAPPAEMIEPLSDRELEVLRFIAAGLSNREIAQRLVLSLSTVKWHTSNIYGKLGVKNRTQAVAQARQMGLLSVI